MSYTTIVFGFIEGLGAVQPDYFKLHKLNCAVIENLPLRDDEPALCRTMFSCNPSQFDDENMWEIGFFRSQIIHFGASFKSWESAVSEIEKWLLKFEDLLRNLFWGKASVFVKTEICGDLCITWKGIPSVRSYLTDAPLPTTEWARTLSQGESVVEKFELLG